MKWRAIGSTLALTAAIACGPARAEQADDAMAILKAMSDYIASQKSVAVSFNTDIEAVTPELQKIQFTASGSAELTRPDKFHARRTGGYADVEVFFDGKSLVIENRIDNKFAQVPTAGSFDQMVDKIRVETGADIAGADLLVSNPLAALGSDVIDAKHIGQGVVNGVECEHLAFRNAETDWQLWVESGPKPTPRKLVITSKSAAEAPQYTLTITEWKSDAAVPPATFEFKAPAGVTKVEFKDLGEIDEVPPGQISGGKK